MSNATASAALPPDDAGTAGIEHTLQVPSEGSAVPPAGGGKSASSGRKKRQEMPKDYSEIEQLLKRYVLLYGSKTVYDKDKHIIIGLDAMAAAFPTWFKYWKEHPERQMLDQDRVVFEPEGKLKQGYLNLWRGWQMKPKKGDCSKLLDLLVYLCGDDAAVFEWVVRWLAYPLRNPGTKMQTALILHGDEGSGKNLFFEAMKRIYGPYGTIIGQDQLEAQWNGWLSGKLFAVADEVVSRQEIRHHKGRLKSYVTGTEIIINEKFIQGRTERNCLNFVFLSNEIQPLSIDESDRRHLVIYTPPAKPREYYSAVKAEIDSGGIEALYHYLMHDVDMVDFTDHTKPLMTEAKRRLINISLSSPHQFFLEWSTGQLPVPFVSCRTRDLYQAYKRWCDKTGDRFPFPMARMKAEIERKIPAKIARIGDEKTQASCFIVNPGLRRPDQTEAAWMLAAVEVFVEALQTFSRGWNQGFDSSEVGNDRS
jgi:phage/plasmid-associated DNA primase